MPGEIDVLVGISLQVIKFVFAKAVSFRGPLDQPMPIGADG